MFCYMPVAECMCLMKQSPHVVSKQVKCQTKCQKLEGSQNPFWCIATTVHGSMLHCLKCITLQGTAVQCSVCLTNCRNPYCAQLTKQSACAHLARYLHKHEIVYVTARSSQALCHYPLLHMPLAAAITALMACKLQASTSLLSWALTSSRPWLICDM